MALGKKRLIALALAAFMAGASGLALADTLQKVQVGKAIHLGYRSASVPFSYADKAGNPRGYAIELCKHLAAAIGKELKLSQLQLVWIPVGPNERNSALADLLVDIDCADSTVTTQSQKLVAFSIPIFVASTRLMVPTRQSGDDLGQLRGKKVVTTTQSGNEAMLRHVLGQTGVSAEVIVARTPKGAMEALRNGQAEAFFADDATLFGLKLSGKDVGDYKVLPKTYSLRPKAITFRRDDEKLRAIVLREMKALIADGTLARWHEQWFNSPLPDGGINLSTPLAYLLRETWRTPTDAYVDYSYGHLPD